jgi:hypothetical protein
MPASRVHSNPLTKCAREPAYYTGQIAHKGQLYPGQHPALMPRPGQLFVAIKLGVAAMPLFSRDE